MVDHEATEQTPALTDYRYIGSDPYNYVTFNGNETWRIIGVFSVDDGNGNYEERVKLIRNESLGGRQWDSNNVSEWVGSTMQTYLNDMYTLDDNSKEMIESTKYYLGGSNNNTSNGENFYISEKSEHTYSGRSKNWTGQVALMYTSDYIFTYSLGVDDSCYNNPSSCKNSTPSSGWLYRSGYHQWTLTPQSSAPKNVFFIYSGGIIGSYTNYSFGVLPVLYIKPNVKIKSGDGTIDNPYEFEL